MQKVNQLHLKVYIFIFIEAIELELNNMTVATQPLGFSDFTPIDAANSFKEVDINSGSLIH